MKYVRYKLDKTWHDQVKVTKNGYYFYPYFISDGYDMFLLNLEEDWKPQFQTIKKETFFKKLV